MDMWHDYLGPKCIVYGVDIREECKSYEKAGVNIFIGDQGNKSFWKEFKKAVPRIDIVIDDGSHVPEHQIVGLEELLPVIRPGGLYICEDIHGAHNRFSAYLSGLASELNRMLTDGPELSPVQTTEFQRAVHSFHIYPFVSIEKATAGSERLESIRRGTACNRSYNKLRPLTREPRRRGTELNV
jgi:hypothetical protein